MEPKYPVHPEQALALEELEKLIGESFYCVEDVIESKSYFDRNRPILALPFIVVFNQDVVGLEIKGHSLENLPESILNLNSLKILILEKCDLKIFPEVILNLKSLINLDLKLNKLEHIPEPIDDLKSLQKLNLQGNDLKAVPKSIVNLKFLQELNLQDNNLKALPESIGNLESLEVLNLKNNELVDLPISLGDFTSLRELKIEKNRLESLPKFMKDSRFITRIIHDRYPDVALEQSRIIGELELLTGIAFRRESEYNIKKGRRNHLEGVGIEDGKIVMLTLGSGGLKVFPAVIRNLKSLEDLALFYNQLTTLPEFISDLKALQVLDLSYNKLSKLPSSIGELEALKKLNLNSNELEYLPQSIVNLSSLQKLSLDHNNLVTLPNSIGNLAALKSLSVSTNKLESLPDSILDLESLTYIYLKDNFFPKDLPKMYKNKALKSKGPIKKLLIKVALACDEGVVTRDLYTQNDSGDWVVDMEKIKKIESRDYIEVVRYFDYPLKQKLKFFYISKKNNLKAVAYAGTIALIGLMTFLILRSLFQNLNLKVIWILFYVALGLNFLVGTAIISTLSSYIKNYIDPIFIDQEWGTAREIIYRLFDVFVLFYFVWAIRSIAKIGLTIELIPSINFIFEYTIPEWFLDFLTVFGYIIDLTFLENLDLFFGHFILKLLGSALIFWALYRNGLGFIRKTAFEEEESKNIWYFLVLGLLGAFLVTIIAYSTLEPFLSIGYSTGVILGATLFIWENNKEKPYVFYFYISFITIGIIIVWILSFWNMIISFIAGVIIIVIFFIVRWRLGKI